MIKSSRNFTDEDWQKTPESVKKAFIALEEFVIQLYAKVQEHEKIIEQLTIKYNKNSSNSNKPPSTDNPYKETGQKKTRGKPGARKGHKGHRQKLLEPTDEVPVYPDKCSCGCSTLKNQEAFYTHQEIELPEIKLDVTHFILYQGECANCGKILKAEVPREHRTGFGARLSSFITDMAGIQGSSRRIIQEFCASVFKRNISLGAIQKIIDRASQAIKPHYDALGEVARKSLINNIDETTWKKNGALFFLWVMVNVKVAFFKIHKNRSKQAFYALIKDWKGILISDDYNVYQRWYGLRQSCLSHLIRHAEGLSEHPKKDIRQFGEKVHEKLQTLCHMAKCKPSPKEFDEFFVGFIDLLFDYYNRRFKDEAGKFARRLIHEIDSLFVFLEVSGVEPTNNAAERSLRFGVLWRKRSQGTRSDKGNKWVERILSLKQTARLRNMSCFDILVDAFNAYFKEQKPDLSWI